MPLIITSTTIDVATFLMFLAMHRATLKLITLMNCKVDWRVVKGLRLIDDLKLEGLSLIIDPDSVDADFAQTTTIILESVLLAFVNNETVACRSIDGTILGPEHEGLIRTVKRADFIDLAEDEAVFWDWGVFRESDRLRIFVWYTDDKSKNETEYYSFRYRDNTSFVAKHPYAKHPDWDLDAGDTSQAVPWGRKFDRFLMDIPTCFEPEDPDKEYPDHAFEYDLYDNDNPFHVNYHDHY